MNPAYGRIIAATDREREQLFLTTAERMGTGIGLIEKDFWLCWILDVVFSGFPMGEPRRLFKGGTSLSKAHGLVERFSEDVDLVIFRGDLGHDASIDQLQQMGRNRRKEYVKGVLAACQDHIATRMLPLLTELVTEAMTRADIARSRFNVELDQRDGDGQNILFTYPSVTDEGDYFQRAILIEAGPRSAIEPYADQTIRPYVADDYSQADLAVSGVTTVNPGRTFWDKIILLHGLRQTFEVTGHLPHDGNRASRHYYDLHRLHPAVNAEAWLLDVALRESCVLHADIFFSRPRDRRDLATPGSFTLFPNAGMQAALRADYERMRGMIFGSAPSFEEVLASIEDLERRVN